MEFKDLSTRFKATREGEPGERESLGDSHAESLRIRASDLETEGELAEVRWTVSSGAVRRGRFCPSCGVRLFHDSGEFLHIKGGTLDDTSWLMPAGHIWTRSRQPHVRFAEGELVYEKGPGDDFAALVARWREMTGA